jgi:hypothetical protein
MNIRAKLCGACRWGTPVAVRQMSAEEAAWLAGILEGEGSFISTSYCSLQVTMTDRDIIARLVAITGVGRVHERRAQNPHHKPSQLWVVARHEQIRQLIEAVLPWLGERRSEAALRLLKKVVERPGHTRSFLGPSRNAVLASNLIAGLPPLGHPGLVGSPRRFRPVFAALKGPNPSQWTMGPRVTRAGFEPAVSWLRAR